MGNTIRCARCGKDFPSIKNQIQCPHCHSVLLPADIDITDITPALQYIHLYSAESLFSCHALQSMLKDILGAYYYPFRFVHEIYRAAENEISEWLRTMIAGGDQTAQLSAVCRALHDALIAPDMIDRFLSVFFDCFDLDADSLLCGAGQPRIPGADYQFHEKELAAAIRSVFRTTGMAAWRSGNAATVALSVRELPLLEVRLVRYAAEVAGKEFQDYLQHTFSDIGQQNAARQAAMRLRTALREHFLCESAIEVLLHAVESAGGHSLDPGHQLVPTARPQITTTNTNGISSPVATVQTTAAYTTGTTSTVANNTAIVAGTNNAAAVVGTKNVIAPVTTISQPVSKPGTVNNIPPPHSKHHLRNILIAAVCVTLIVVLSKNLFASDVPAQNQSAASVPTQSTTPTNTIPTNSTPTEPRKADPYPAPKVQTTTRQSGSYGIGNILTTSQFAEYQGPFDEFSFKYPRVLYDQVCYAFQEDGSTIDILFTSKANASELHVRYQEQVSVPSAESQRDTLLAAAQQELADVKILISQNHSNGRSTDSNHTTNYTIWLKGTLQNGTVEEYRLFSVTDRVTETLVLKIPVGETTEDRAMRDYYAECMYDMCGFGGNTSVPLWKDFRKPYGL